MDCESQKDNNFPVPAPPRPPVDTEAILARIQRLEELVADKGQTPSLSPPSYQRIPFSTPSPSQATETDDAYITDTREINDVSVENLEPEVVGLFLSLEHSSY
jgi:hypothetical protein